MWFAPQPQQIVVALQNGIGEHKAKNDMPSAATVRNQVEAVLAARIPAALTLPAREIRPVTRTGIAPVDDMLQGLPVGAITELVGPHCSGRTSFALTSLSRLTQSGRAVAWVDASNALDSESAAAAGVELSRLLWVRCGAAPCRSAALPKQSSFAVPEQYFVPPAAKKGLHGGGHGGHPRTEMNGVANALHGLLGPAPPANRVLRQQQDVLPSLRETVQPLRQSGRGTASPQVRIDQALRVTDLLLQAGGFAAIVLDLADLAPELCTRVPLTTWFRYRAAAERTQANFLLLTQHACAKSSAGLVLQMHSEFAACSSGETVLTAVEHRVAVVRQRFSQTASNVVPMRKPPRSTHSDSSASWQSHAAWAGLR